MALMELQLGNALGKPLTVPKASSPSRLPVAASPIRSFSRGALTAEKAKLEALLKQERHLVNCESDPGRDRVELDLKAFERQLLHQADHLDRLDKQTRQVTEMLSSRRLLGVQWPQLPEATPPSKKQKEGVNSRSPTVSFWSSGPVMSPRRHVILKEEMAKLPRTRHCGFRPRGLAVRSSPSLRNTPASSLSATLDGKQRSAVLQAIHADHCVTASDEVVEEMDSILMMILEDTTDSGDSLKSAVSTGGSNHATVLSCRAKAVARKKAALLSGLEAAVSAYQAILKRKEQILTASLDISGPGVSLGKAAGLRQLIRDSVHDGDPKPKKRLFDVFLRQLGLPPQHQMVLEARAVLERGVEDLTAEALQALQLEREKVEACEMLTLSKGVDQMIPVLLALSVMPSHGVIQDLKRQAKEMRAEYLRFMTDRAKSRDQLRAEKGEGGRSAHKTAYNLRRVLQILESLGLPEACSEIMTAKAAVLDLRAEAVFRDARSDEADDKEGKLSSLQLVAAFGRIRAEAMEAEKFGCRSDDLALMKARLIADNLHANKVLRQAVSLQEVDTKAVEFGSYRSGDATEAAAMIENEVQAFSMGASADHPVLKEATGICKYLREQEGLRKRQRYADAQKADGA